MDHKSKSAKKKPLNMRGMFDNKNKNNFKFYYCIGFKIC